MAAAGERRQPFPSRILTASIVISGVFFGTLDMRANYMKSHGTARPIEIGRSLEPVEPVPPEGEIGVDRTEMEGMTFPKPSHPPRELTLEERTRLVREAPLYSTQVRTVRVVTETPLPPVELAGPPVTVEEMFEKRITRRETPDGAPLGLHNLPRQEELTGLF